jgi:hypothetical protein
MGSDTQTLEEAVPTPNHKFQILKFRTRLNSGLFQKFRNYLFDQFATKSPH